MSTASSSPDREDKKKSTVKIYDDIYTPPTQDVAVMEEYVPGSEAEKKLLRKIDMRIMVSSPTFRLLGSADDTCSHACGVGIAFRRFERSGC
jgi:hypothetical protein